MCAEWNDKNQTVTQICTTKDYNMSPDEIRTNFTRITHLLNLKLQET